MLVLVRLIQFRHCLGIFLQPLAAFVSRHELLHPGVAAVDDKDAAFGIDCNPVGKIELAVAVSESAPLGDEVAFAIELFNTVVAGIRHIHVAGSVDGNAPG